MPKTPSILFVCWGNTCRSVMFEVFARQRFGDSADIATAGVEPQQPEDAKSAIETLKYEFGIDVPGHTPRHVKYLDFSKFTHIIAADRFVAKELRNYTNRDLTVWKIDDPWDELVEYKRSALQIKKAVQKLNLK